MTVAGEQPGPASAARAHGADLDLAVGIDVGGTKIAVGLVERSRGELLVERRAPTLPAEGGQAVLERSVALVREVLAAARVGVPVPVGIALCELVDREGRPASADTVDWRALDPVERFAEVGPAVLESDVRAAALAEARFGALSGARSGVLVIIGTGVASCLVLDGRPWPGAHGAAITLGSRPLARGVPALESFASGGAIARLAGAADARAAFFAAESGDERARAVVEEAVAALGGAVATIVNLLDPERVVLGGGIGSAPGLAARIAAAARPFIYAPAAREVPIVPAALGDRAGVVGAALRAPA